MNLQHTHEGKSAMIIVQLIGGGSGSKAQRLLRKGGVERWITVDQKEKRKAMDKCGGHMVTWMPTP